MADTSNAPALRIRKLPDLTPVKMTILVDPETHQALEEYALIYAEAYGETVETTALAPIMLTNFLASDHGFKKARKARGPAHAK